MTRPAEAYGADLAYVHNVGYDFHARGLAPELLKLFGKAGLSGSVVVDVGCGGGIWAAVLAWAGYRPVGVDFSSAMIAEARRRLPEGEFHVGSFLNFSLPNCGAITALGEVVCYLFDEGNNRRALGKWIKRAYEALVEGGLLVFDIAEPALDRDTPPSWRWGEDWACGVWREYDERRLQLTRHITTFRREGKLFSRSEESHRVQLYERHEIARMLRAAGFAVRTARRLGKYEMLPKRALFIAKKG